MIDFGIVMKGETCSMSKFKTGDSLRKCFTLGFSYDKVAVNFR